MNEELLSYAESLLPNVPHPVPMQDMRVVLRPADDDATSEISVLDLNNSKEKYVLPSKIEVGALLILYIHRDFTFCSVTQEITDTPHMLLACSREACC